MLGVQFSSNCKDAFAPAVRKEAATSALRGADQQPPSFKSQSLDGGMALLHEDGQEGVRVDYTKQGLKPCHRPLVAVLAEGPLIANFWLRRGDVVCLNHAADFCRARWPACRRRMRIGLVRADGGFCSRGIFPAAKVRRESGLGSRLVYLQDRCSLCALSASMASSSCTP